MLERGAPLVAAAVVLAGLVAVFPPDDRDPPPPAPPPEPAFLDAWERSRTAELVVLYEAVRTYADGQELAFAHRVVQRPPDDELRIGAGSASGRLDGRIIRCNSVGTGPPECVRGTEAPPYDEVVADEVATLAELIEPETGIYDLDDLGDGCFGLTLGVAVPAPPYGSAARFCFDEPSGALAEVVVERDEAVDRSNAVEIRTEVTAADLRAEDIGEPLTE